MNWRKEISNEAFNLLRDAGYGGSITVGESPCLLIVDATYGFTGRRELSQKENIKEFPKSASAMAWNAIPPLCDLLIAFRDHGWPAVMTVNAGRHDPIIRGAWRHKVDDDRDRSPFADELVAELVAIGYGTHLPKTKPSAFFGTPLLAWLNSLRVDTVIIAGGTTSGCVRASAVDAFSYNFSTVVCEDAVFDRNSQSHLWSLFDMSMKYADVRCSRDVLEDVYRRVPKGAGS